MVMEKEILSWLPQEIIIEILSWVPTNSLVSSFKFVCKAWRNLIHDSDFIKMHLNRGAIHGGGGGGGSLIRKPRTDIETMDESRFGNQLFQLHLPFNYEGGFVIAPRTKLDVDCDLISSRSRLVGSCNGLLCLNVVSDDDDDDDENIILLNPSTRKYKISPKKPIERPSPFTTHKPATYGFGCYYNSTTNIDEYKVVRIVHFYPTMNWGDPQSFQLQIHIYSLSSNSWRSSLEKVDEDIPYDICQERLGLFLNGVVHWMGCKLQQGDVWYWDTILSFNIRDEEFRQVPMPPCADVVVNDNAEYPYLNDYTILMNVRGCLGIAYFSRTEMMDVVLEIWVMKEYGIGESWTKEFVIRTSYSDRELSASYMFSRCMTCFLTGDKILVEVIVCAGHGLCNTLPYTIPPLKDFGRLVSYDMNKKEIDGDFRMFDMPYEHYRDDRVDYIETLVSLKSSLLASSNN